jgi:hypothetical protein
VSFIAFFLFYYQFYNINIFDVNMDNTGSLTQGNFSMIKVINFYFMLFSIMVTYALFSNPHKRWKYFDQFNFHLMLVTLIVGTISFVGFPFHQFSVILDGHHRSTGIFGHPSLYASHMGITLTYLVGMFFFYMYHRKLPWPKWVLYLILMLCFFGFLVGFSKTSIAAFLISVCVLVIGHLQLPSIRAPLTRDLTVLGGLGFVSFSIFAVFYGEGIVEIIQNRVEDTNSLSSRLSRWEFLVEDISATTILVGHGLTAAVGEVLTRWFDRNDGAPVIMVHNGYIELFYDMGLIGLLFVISLFSTVKQALSNFRNAFSSEQKTLSLVAIAIAVYYLVELGFGEVMMIQDICYMVWVFIVICLSLCIPAKVLADQQEKSISFTNSQ